MTTWSMTTFVDDRGAIRNVGHVAVIHSKAGSVRSNHYHKEGWHYLYVLSGAMRYSVKMPLAWSRLVGPGEFVFSGPGEWHRTEFLEDTVMVSLASANQGPEHHEEDCVRVEW